MRRLVLAVGLLSLVSCGGGSGGSSNSSGSPTTPTAANRSPVINSMSMNPAFGIAQLTAFTFSASASDPDGDAVSYAWDVAGNPFSTASGQITFTGGGNGVATLTVTDSKGAKASDSRPFIVATMAGTWNGTLAGVPITMTLAQPAGGIVTGTWAQSLGSGILDPATVNKIDPSGNVTMRLKVMQGRFNDFTMTGTMDQTGARFIGVANGSGFSGSPVILTK